MSDRVQKGGQPAVYQRGCRAKVALVALVAQPFAERRVGPPIARYRPTSIFVIFRWILRPLGSATSTMSLRLRPSSALPTGDS